ncbi:hypothetical protein H4219_006391, partial [Mycoemilia scoparia]
MSSNTYADITADKLELIAAKVTKLADAVRADLNMQVSAAESVDKVLQVLEQTVDLAFISLRRQRTVYTNDNSLVSPVRDKEPPVDKNGVKISWSGATAPDMIAFLISSKWATDITSSSIYNDLLKTASGVIDRLCTRLFSDNDICNWGDLPNDKKTGLYDEFEHIAWNLLRCSVNTCIDQWAAKYFISRAWINKTNYRKKRSTYSEPSTPPARKKRGRPSRRTRMQTDSPATPQSQIIHSQVSTPTQDTNNDQTQLASIDNDNIVDEVSYQLTPMIQRNTSASSELSVDNIQMITDVTDDMDN